VAGVVGGATFGVAKAATLISVTIFNCQAQSNSDVVALAIDDFIIPDHISSPSVINISGSATQGSLVLDQAVQRAIDAGITIVASAGNDDVDASGGSPARVPGVVIVGATDITDHRASFEGPKKSNFGPRLDLWAPARVSRLPGTCTIAMSCLTSWERRHPPRLSPAWQPGTSSSTPGHHLRRYGALWWTVRALLPSVTQGRDRRTGSPSRASWTGVVRHHRHPRLPRG